MPTDTQKKYSKLSSVLSRIKEILQERTGGVEFWFTAEISNINHHKSGHCYIELSENENDQLIAQCKAIIWNRNLYEIEKTLKSDLHNILKQGNEVLFKAIVAFSEVYGLQLHILEVDISFSLGSVEKRKQEVIKSLTDEGLVNKNKLVSVPTIIQRIALIGSPKTSGYTDFVEQLIKNQYAYNYTISTFSCAVQGEKAEPEILSAFNNARKGKFDLVVLIRGGGSKLDLEVFNSYKISKSIAEFPMPVWTGIGHETDFSVCDMVANLNHKTPSALASHIVEMARNFEVVVISTFNESRKLVQYKLDALKRLNDLAIQIVVSEPVSRLRLRRGELHNTSSRLINVARESLNSKNQTLVGIIRSIFTQVELQMINRRNELKSFFSMLELRISNVVSISSEKIDGLLQEVVLKAAETIKSKWESMSNINDLLSAYDPHRILAKGYSIVRIKGELLRNQKLAKGDKLEIELQDRRIDTEFINEKK